MAQSKETYSIRDTHRWTRQLKQGDGQREAIDENVLRADLTDHFIDVDAIIALMAQGKIIDTPFAWYEQTY